MDGRAGSRAGAPISVTRITTGHSNEVFRVERGDLVAVLRRPPRTPLSPTAHDMAREFRVLTALHDPAGWHDRRRCPCRRRSRAAPMSSVIGAPFYLMHVVDGVVVRESMPPVFGADDAESACLRLSRWSTRSRVFTGSTGAPADSTASVAPTATSNGRSPVGSVSSRVQDAPDSRRSTKRGSGSRRGSRPRNLRA